MFAKKKEAPASLALTPLEQPRTAPAQVQPQQAAPARPKPASLFSQGLTVRGDIVGDVEVHVDCAVLGDVKVGKLVVGPNARIEGSIVAQAIEIHGLVIGAVTAQAVRLYGTSRVDGDITHEQLAMETGAEFQGRSLKFRRPVAPQPQGHAPQAHAQPHAQQAPAPQAAPQSASTAPSASQTPYSHVSH
jgi:cytoskeletal protein CcmA (bactofilin family)